MPQIVALLGFYRADEPQGIRTQLTRDHDDENLATELSQIRKRCDEEYAAFLSAGGMQNQAVMWMQWYLRDACRRREYDRDVALSVQVIGIIDLMERIGVLKRDMHNGLYVVFADPFPMTE